MDEEITSAKFATFLYTRSCVKIAKNKDEFFTLKSGRKSPVFVNMGSLIDGQALFLLANAYADKIHSLIKSSQMQDFDFIYGPAYKGIPLGAITAAALYQKYKISKKFIYDRKEEKTHGDVKADKIIVGADQFFDGAKVLMIDDVISSGKSKFESYEKLKVLGKSFSLVGVLVAVDRQEAGGDDKLASDSAADEIHKKLNCHLFSIASMGELFVSISPTLSREQTASWKKYFQDWGSPDAKIWAK
ncbi:MAG: orotate phosphoribosyltransferase [Candidatus Micrarchaeia archaeon]